MKVLMTGVAGFIGCHVALALLARGDTVVGIDDMNSYYDPALKEARLALLSPRAGFEFDRVDIADADAMVAFGARHADFELVIHLAAQAGVRYSLSNPRAYIRSNIMGHLEVLELCRAQCQLRHLVYASSSSVYGGNTSLPFAVGDRCESPQSLYAATKIADEAMSSCYSQLYGIPSTGLRFFTVYGPWGRPDMAPMIFARAILAGEPIRLFNQGNMRRDFTYIDDVVAGVLAAADHPPPAAAPHVVYNLGNHRAEPLERFVSLLEIALGKDARIVLDDMQPGDIEATFANIESAAADLGYHPVISIDDGIPRFAAWYRDWFAAA